MYDIKRRKEFKTIGELRKLIEDIPDDAKVVIMGDDYCWFHVTKDNNVVCFDCEDLDDGYDAEGEGRCTICGGALNYGIIEVCDTGVYYPVECQNCGTAGKEYYDITYTQTEMKSGSNKED